MDITREVKSKQFVVCPTKGETTLSKCSKCEYFNSLEEDKIMCKNTVEFLKSSEIKMTEFIYNNTKYKKYESESKDNSGICYGCVFYNESFEICSADTCREIQCENNTFWKEVENE